MFSLKASLRDTCVSINFLLGEASGIKLVPETSKKLKLPEDLLINANKFPEEK